MRTADKVLHPSAEYLAGKLGGRVLNFTVAVTILEILVDTAYIFIKA